LGTITRKKGKKKFHHGDGGPESGQKKWKKGNKVRQLARRKGVKGEDEKGWKISLRSKTGAGRYDQGGKEVHQTTGWCRIRGRTPGKARKL